MSESSSIFLLGNQLKSDSGLSILPSTGTSISTSSVSSSDGATTSVLRLNAYDQNSPNVLINGSFSTNDFTGWTNSGTSIVDGSLPGFSYILNLPNLSSVTQTVTGFTNKNVVVTLWHIGNPVIISLETDDDSDILKSSENQTIPYSSVWNKFEIGLYSLGTGGTKAKLTLSSVWDGSYVGNIQMFCLDDYISIGVGDGYVSNRDVLSIRGRKLFIGAGDQLISTRSEMLDVRGDGFFSGSLYINGTINANIVYPQISLQPFATNIIFSSGSSTGISWTSGLIQFVSTLSFGISSGSATLSDLTYFFLDSDVSSTVLQSSTTYTDCLGNSRVLIASAQNSASGNASIKLYSGQQSLINGANQITPLSIVNGNFAAQSITADKIVANSITSNEIMASTITADRLNITTLSAITGSMGSLTIDNTLTMGASGKITMGATGPSTGSGMYLDSTGFYSVLSSVQQSSMTNLGFSAGGGKFVADVNGVTLYSGSTITSPSTLKIIDSTFTTTNVFSLYSYNNSGLTQQETHLIATAPVAGRNTLLDLFASGLTGTVPEIQLRATADSATASIILTGNTPSFCTITSSLNTILGDFTVDAINVGNSLTGATAGTIRLSEISTPSAPGTNNAAIYVADNGAGKTQLIVRFATGAVQILATQP